MDILDLRTYTLSLPLVEECQPFGDDAVVYKVGGKMFMCCVLEHAERVAVKCNPDRAIILRDEYISAIKPAWHFNKKHWNDLYFEQLPREEIMAVVREAQIEDAEAIE